MATPLILSFQSVQSFCTGKRNIFDMNDDPQPPPLQKPDFLGVYTTETTVDVSEKREEVFPYIISQEVEL